MKESVIKKSTVGFPGGSVADSALLMQGAWVQFPVRELDPEC